MDILSAISRIQEYTAVGKDVFLTDLLVQDAVLRQLSIIGEAVSRLPASLTDRSPTIPWHDIVGMRNAIIHEYSGTNLVTIWLTTQDDLPKLQEAVELLLRLQEEGRTAGQPASAGDAA